MNCEVPGLTFTCLNYILENIHLRWFINRFIITTNEFKVIINCSKICSCDFHLSQQLPNNRNVYIKQVHNI